MKISRRFADRVQGRRGERVGDVGELEAPERTGQGRARSEPRHDDLRGSDINVQKVPADRIGKCRGGDAHDPDAEILQNGGAVRSEIHGVYGIAHQRRCAPSRRGGDQHCERSAHQHISGLHGHTL